MQYASVQSLTAGDRWPMAETAAPAPPRFTVIKLTDAAAKRTDGRVFPADHGPFNGFLRDAFKTPLTRLTLEPAAEAAPPTPPSTPL